MAAGAPERIALVADPGSFEPWDEDVVSDDPLRFSDVRPYADRLAEARARTGLSESVLTGLIEVEGRAGRGCRRRVRVPRRQHRRGHRRARGAGARAGDRAAGCRCSRCPASGGTRMQEGAPALMQMAKLAAAVRRCATRGLPYIVCLMHPTTGGVLASWGSLGHVTWAEPNALLGFGGPRVVEMLTGEPLPDDVQRAEHLLERGLLDDVVAAEELRERVSRVLAVTAAPRLRSGHAAVLQVERSPRATPGPRSSTRATRQRPSARRSARRLGDRRHAAARRPRRRRRRSRVPGGARARARDPVRR
jgi:acetyl-CoA carboxylase carboxyl transferase subunit beta